MTRRIFKISDNCAYYWIAAKDHADARALWVQSCRESGGYESDEQFLADVGEPHVTVVQPTKAASVTVVLNDEQERCSSCQGTGRVSRKTSLLTAFHDDESKEPEKRVAHGVLACSEW